MSYSTEMKSVKPEKMSVFFVITLTSFAIISIESMQSISCEFIHRSHVATICTQVIMDAIEIGS